MAEPEAPEVDPALGAESEKEDTPRRRRSRKAESGPQPDERGHVLRVNEDGTNRFSPFVTTLSVKAQRTVRTGQYESFEISNLITFEPDRRFSTVENTARVNNFVTDEVNRVADEIAAKFSV